MKKIILATGVALVVSAGAGYWVFHGLSDEPPAQVAAAVAPAGDSAGMAKTEALAVAPSEAIRIEPIKTMKQLNAAFAEIDAAAKSATPESLARLIAYASVGNKDVSAPALDALVRRGDRAAVPLLREAAKKLEDPREAVALLDTADLIDLPSATFANIAPRKASMRKQMEAAKAAAAKTEAGQTDQVVKNPLLPSTQTTTQ